MSSALSYVIDAVESGSDLPSRKRGSVCLRRNGVRVPGGADHDGPGRITPVKAAPARSECNLGQVRMLKKLGRGCAAGERSEKLYIAL